MLRWIILGWTAGPGVPDLKIEAESFDEALAKAREVDSRYSGSTNDILKNRRKENART